MTTTHNTGLAHCVHHNIHFEWCYDLANRHRVIDSEKPKEEQAIRHANLWLFPPSQITAEWRKANAEWRKTCAEWAPGIQALHDRLVQEQGYICTWNGQDIFEAKGG